MKTINEKEKKLTEALNKLTSLNLQNLKFNEEIKSLDDQRNQLKIEKDELENKYNSLREDYDNLKIKLSEINDSKQGNKAKETQFYEKIDELNQETDSLLEELDKWQM